MRARVLEVLGHVVHGRISMEVLQAGLLVDLQRGIEPLVFGVYWTKEHLDMVFVAGQLIQAAFDVLKWLQAPGSPGRLEDAAAILDQIRPALPASNTAITQTAMKARIASTGEVSQSRAPAVRDRSRVG